MSQFRNTDFIIARLLRTITMLNEYCDVQYLDGPRSTSQSYLTRRRIFCIIFYSTIILKKKFWETHTSVFLPCYQIRITRNVHRSPRKREPPTPLVVGCNILLELCFYFCFSLERRSYESQLCICGEDYCRKCLLRK